MSEEFLEKGESNVIIKSLSTSRIRPGKVNVLQTELLSAGVDPLS